MQIKKKGLKKKELLNTLLLAFVVSLMATAFISPQAVQAQTTCVDGLIDTDGDGVGDGDPCLDINADELASNLFKWASIFIAVFLPVAAIGIGIRLAGNVIGSLGNLVGNFRL